MAVDGPWDQLAPGILRLLERMELPPPRDEGAVRLLAQAFLHRSWAGENPGAGDNERLEFLGDSVIGLVASRDLFDTCPGMDEGELSKMRAAMVSRRTLGKVAQQLELGDLVLLGVGEEASGGRRRGSILGSALEAFCGALSLAYPFETCAAAVRRHIIRPARELADQRGVTDFKSRLQEWTQHRNRKVPEYVLVHEEGPDHQRRFTVEVLVDGVDPARGTGARIKWAENDAARRILEKIEKEVPENPEGAGEVKP